MSFTGLKKFSEICRKDNENVRQSIRTYLLSSPELKDLFNLLEGEERPSDQEVTKANFSFGQVILRLSFGPDAMYHCFCLVILNNSIFVYCI